METRKPDEYDNGLGEIEDYGNDLGVIENPRRKTNKLQRLSQVAYKYTVDGVALTAVLTTEFIPNVIPQPFKEMTKAGVFLAGINVADAVHALTERKHPFTGLTWRTPVTCVIATALPIATSAGLGMAVKYYGGEIEGNSTTINITNYNATSLIVNNPLAHMTTFGLLYYAQFGVTKLFIECCIKQDKTNEEGGQNLFQAALKVGVNVVEPIAMYMALHMVLLEVGQDPVLQNQFFPMVVVGMDQILKLWGHMSRIPRPLDNLVSEDTRRDAMNIDELINEGAFMPSSPSYSSIGKSVLYYSMRASIAITAGGLLALEVANHISGNTDQEKMSNNERLLTLFTLAGATGLVEKAFDFAVWAGNSLCSKVSNCRSSLFAPKYQPASADDFFTPEQTNSLLM